MPPFLSHSFRSLTRQREICGNTRRRQKIPIPHSRFELRFKAGDKPDAGEFQKPFFSAKISAPVRHSGRVTSGAMSVSQDIRALAVDRQHSTLRGQFGLYDVNDRPHGMQLHNLFG
jgi:hypothetical protein